jgi:exodeoxyribonuclease VIII
MSPSDVRRRLERCYADYLPGRTKWRPPAGGAGHHLLLPNEEYHAGPGVSKSTLVRAQATMHHALFPDEPAPGSVARANLDLGSALNDCLLLPRRWKRRYVRGPGDRRGTKWAGAVEAAGPNRAVLVEKDYDFVLTMAKAVRNHPNAGPLVHNPQAVEPTIYWQDPDTGILCRCRPDVVTASADVVDIKSAYDGTLEGFARAIRSHRYHWSDGFTSAGMQALRPGWRGAYAFLVIDKELVAKAGVQGVALYSLRFEDREAGRSEVRSALDRFDEAARAAMAEERPWLGHPRGVTQLNVFDTVSRF